VVEARHGGIVAKLENSGLLRVELTQKFGTVNSPDICKNVTRPNILRPFVARHGVQVVGGSNPLAPTKIQILS
jgi:hypothetical protein